MKSKVKCNLGSVQVISTAGHFGKVEGWMKKRGVLAVRTPSSSHKKLGVGTADDIGGVGVPARFDMVVVVRSKEVYMLGSQYGHGTLLLGCLLQLRVD
jgi:hypothetical protein